MTRPLERRRASKIETGPSKAREVFFDSSQHFTQQLASYADGITTAPAHEAFEADGHLVHLHEIKVVKVPREASQFETNNDRDEIWYCLEGELTIEVGTADATTQYVLQPGDQLYIPFGTSNMKYTSPNKAARIAYIQATPEPNGSTQKAIYVSGQDGYTRSLTADSIPKGDSRGPNDQEVKSHAPGLFLTEMKYNRDYPRADSHVEVHRWRGEIWFCLEGKMTFEIGGTMIDPTRPSDREIRSKNSTGGRTYVLRPGQQLFVPAGVSHMHYTNSQESARVAFTKVAATFNTPDGLFPLRQIPTKKSQKSK